MGELQDLRGYIEQLEGIAKAVVAKAGVSGANAGYALANVGVKVDELKSQLAAALKRAEDAERERDRLAAAVERVREACKQFQSVYDAHRFGSVEQTSYAIGLQIEELLDAETDKTQEGE